MTIQIAPGTALAPGGYVADAVGRLSSTSSAALYNRNQQQQLQLLDIRTRAWQSFNLRFLALKQAAEALQADDTWALTSARTSSDAFTAQAGSGAAAGTYSVRVLQLARPQVIASGTVDDTYAALGISGIFTADDLTIEVFAGDSLRDIATSLNAVNNATAVSSAAPAHASAGGTISVNGREIAIGAGSSLLAIRDTVNAEPLLGGHAAVVQDRLFLAGDDGAAIALGDTAGTVLTDLGLMDSGSRTGTPPGLDLAALIEDNARMLLARQNSTERIRLDMGSQVLQDLGFINGNRTLANQVSAPQQALITVDGTAYSSGSNTIADAVPGVTLQLNGITGYARRLTVAADTSAAFSALENLVTQYNNAMDELNAAAGFQGPFFMDRDVWDIRDELIKNLTRPLAGLPGPLNQAAGIGLNVREEPANVVNGFNLIKTVSESKTDNSDISWSYGQDESLLLLSDIGIIYDQELGTLEFDADRLARTLASAPGDVQALFTGGSDTFASRIAAQAGLLIDPSSGTIQKEVQVIDNIRDDVEKKGDETARQTYDFQREEYLALLAVKQLMAGQSVFFMEKNEIYA